ncbi:MAG: DUF92 domain-containing protein [Clostridia bacterium]|nr:DUF92 domain-containing protein [Clostridia bacterium]
MTPEQTKILWGYLGAVAYVLFAIGIALLFYKLGLSKKYTRKIVHILVGFEWVILSQLMGASYHFLIVCAVFTAALALSYFKHLLPAMSSDGENDPGTVYYGISMTVMASVCLFVPEMMLPFGIGVFCTSLGDGLAGVVGQLVKKHNPRIFRGKSLLGTLTNLVTSFGVAVAFKYIYAMESLTLLHCLYIAIFSAGLELIGAFGLDNLMITLGTAALTYALIAYPVTVGYVAPIIIAPYIVAAVIEKRALTAYGLLAALLLDLVTALAFGNLGFFVLISFFVGALAVDKVKKARRREDTITKKEGTRDLIQVIANGLVPMTMASIFIFWQHPAFLVGFVASLAEAFADTVASGMGVFSRTTYDIFKMRKCECGISGGVSLVGTLSSLIASALLSLYLFALGLGLSWIFFLISFAASFLGVVFDSFLGSLFQIKFKCSECGKITERHVHCDKPTTHVQGFAFFDNDVVNLLSGVFSAAVAVAVCFVVL